jgi:hypothetical protein
LWPGSNSFLHSAIRERVSWQRGSSSTTTQSPDLGSTPPGCQTRVCCLWRLRECLTDRRSGHPVRCLAEVLTLKMRRPRNLWETLPRI